MACPKPVGFIRLLWQGVGGVSELEYPIPSIQLQKLAGLLLKENSSKLIRILCAILKYGLKYGDYVR